MIVSYADFDGTPHRVKARITTDHSASSYGQPVIVLADGGGALDFISWVVGRYRVIRATAKERQELNKIGLSG